MEAIEREKSEILLAMYASVDRMNHHMAAGNSGPAQSEKHLQINLRANFEIFLNGE